MSLEKLEKILEKVADIKDIKNYEVHLNEGALTGNGFNSESYTGYVKNKDTNQITHVFIKHVTKSLGYIGTTIYFNEERFYSNIWAELNKFQNEKGVKIPFTNITEFYCGSNEPGEEYICMEDLKIQKFDLLDKSKAIDADILKLIFQQYGQFHGLTFAFKDQNKEKYSELVSPLYDGYNEMGKLNEFWFVVENSFKKAYEGLKEIDPERAEKVKPYAENIKDYYHSVKAYTGQFSALVHGDCWSNNLLFKCKENGIMEDVKFIDFQLCRDSTPIHDLSYFFYSGASEADFKKLDEYLELYHKSFSAFVTELGSDPDKLLPLNILKSEWKKYSLLGLIMGVLLWQMKLMRQNDIQEYSAQSDKMELSKNMKIITESNDFKKYTSAILKHALDYGIL